MNLPKLIDESTGQEVCDLKRKQSTVQVELFDVCRILNAGHGLRVQPLYLTQYGCESSPYGLFGGKSVAFHHADIRGEYASPIDSDVTKRILTVFTAFRKLKPNEQTRFRHILDRLSQAKRRLWPQDKVLDLGIAAEMLLLGDNKGQDQLSQSFRLRGAWLLGEDFQDRQRLHDTLKDLYVLRCQVAHGGVLTGNFIRKASENAGEYERIVEDVLCKVISEGEPVWSDLLLGNRSCLPSEGAPMGGMTRT